jgi:hypothetical protein
MKHTVETINDQKSSKKGAVGFIETSLRRFKSLAFFIALFPIALLYMLALSVAFMPTALIFSEIWGLLQNLNLFLKVLLLAVACSFSFITFVFTLIAVVPVLNKPFIPLVKPFRGAWFSLESIPWLYHNALFYLVRYTVLNLLIPSPISIWFLKAMGMKIGNNVVVNTGNISDPCLIEIDDYATIGGSVYIMAHYGMKGYLVVDRVKIGKASNIGLHSYIMAAEIGESAMILPNTAVLPKTKIPAFAKFGHLDQVLDIKKSQESEKPE